MNAPDTIFAPTKTKAARESINYGIDFTRLLKGSELLAAGQTPTIDVVGNASGLTIGAAAVSASGFTDDYENAVAAFKGVQVQISGGTVGQTYEVLVSCLNNANPALTRTGGIRIFIER